MTWTSLHFGEHKDKSLPQILFSDPDWFFYLYENGGFDNKGSLRLEAEEIYRRASSIKVPQSGSEELEAEYIFYSDDNKFSELRLVPVSKPTHTGSSIAERHKIIDFRIVRQHRGYDKLGYKLFIKDLKFYFFNNRDERMTKKRCEDFFNTDSNFDL